MDVDKEGTDTEENPDNEQLEDSTPLLTDQPETDLENKPLASLTDEPDEAETTTELEESLKDRLKTENASMLENFSDSISTNVEGAPTSPEQEKKIELNAEFESFLELRDALERYQRENCVQLIVKDSKLLSAESTKKIIPKVYHLVNPTLLYHSITYCCKCHGELKLKPKTRVKNVGAKRLNCPMYLRLRLTSDLQRLVLFDLDEHHNHGIDPTTCQMAPRQQVYALSRLRQGKMSWDQIKGGKRGGAGDVGSLIESAIKDVSSVATPVYEPPRKVPKAKEEPQPDGEEEESHNAHRPDSPLDSESSFSDSDEEEAAIQRRLLPFPIRLIGSAVKSSPELIAASRELIEMKKATIELERQKLLLQTKNLELNNLKLELEVKKMERNLKAEAAETDHGQDTTIYLQAS